MPAGAARSSSGIATIGAGSPAPAGPRPLAPSDAEVPGTDAPVVPAGSGSPDRLAAGPSVKAGMAGRETICVAMPSAWFSDTACADGGSLPSAPACKGRARLLRSEMAPGIPAGVSSATTASGGAAALDKSAPGTGADPADSIAVGKIPASGAMAGSASCWKSSGPDRPAPDGAGCRSGVHSPAGAGGTSGSFTAQKNGITEAVAGSATEGPASACFPAFSSNENGAAPASELSVERSTEPSAEG
jgi:hypothetical protein